MTKPQWTIQQRAAIYKSDSDVLLTASAGSGKTAVLAERYLSLLTDKHLKCGVDQILVMTFTTDAVAEMRKRIGDRLAGHVDQFPADLHTRRQMAMLGSAQICTLDSFSAGLLREYFYLADIDPSFDIIDPSEKNLVQTKLLDEILEENYAGQGQIDAREFYRFVNAYGGKSGDNNIPAMVRSLSRFLETVVECDIWLDNCVITTTTLASRVGNFKQLLTERFIREVDNAINKLTLSARLIDEVFETVAGYSKLIQPALESLTDLKQRLIRGLDQQTAQLLADKKNLTLFDRLPSPRNADPDEKQVITSLIGTARDHILKIINKYQGDTNLSRQLAAFGPNMAVVKSLYLELTARYQQFKSANVLLDYADLNHKVIKVLLHHGQPTAAALELRERFRFILVDEYQDISPLQETLLNAISSKSTNGGNMFMVGDVKQSIYRFRQAAPEIILDKHNRFTPVFAGDAQVNGSTPAGGRIELNRNFRSRLEIVNIVNHIFARTMIRDFGGIDYRNDGWMDYGASYYDQTQCRYPGRFGKPVELHLIDTADSDSPEPADQEQPEGSSDDPAETIDSVRQEAILIAQRIRQMVGSGSSNAEFEVLDSTTKTARPVSYRDITILLRSLKSQAAIYAEVFASFGLPFYVQQDSGLFQSLEVKDIISLLRVIDNPQQDIPLAAVLRGPYVGLSENELAEIRVAQPHGYYYHAVLEYIQHGNNSNLVQRLVKLFDEIDIWRTLARTGTLAALIRQIYDHTMLTAYYRGLPDGRQRYANLLFLYQTACEFDSFSTQGLGRFLRHLDSLSNSSDDFGPARILAANDNVVQVMSVHRSKGLEFPVVFVAGLAKKFNLRNDSRGLIFSSLDNGAFAMDLKSPDGSQSWKTLPREILSQQDKIAALHEELRIQYVALTRAREHLILVGSTDISKFCEKCSQRVQLTRFKNIPQDNFRSLQCEASELESASCALDWYSLALGDHREFIGRYPHLSEDNAVELTGDFTLQTHTLTEIQSALAGVGSVEQYNLDDLLTETDIAVDQTKVREIQSRIDWQYPLMPAVTCPARAGVTQLNKSLNSRPEQLELESRRIILDDEAPTLNGDFARKPAFMERESIRVSAADRGVWTHRFLELVDLTASLDLTGLQNQLDEMITSGYFSPEQGENIDLTAIAGFFASQTGQQMANNSNNVLHEWEFTLAVNAREIPADYQTDSTSSSDIVVVRGIIDCLIWNGNSYEIIDFKTDDVNGQELTTRAAQYQFQLAFYKRAVTEITGKNVSSCRLFFLKASREIEIAL